MIFDDLLVRASLLFSLLHLLFQTVCQVLEYLSYINIIFLHIHVCSCCCGTDDTKQEQFASNPTRRLSLSFFFLLIIFLFDHDLIFIILFLLYGIHFLICGRIDIGRFVALLLLCILLLCLFRRTLNLFLWDDWRWFWRGSCSDGLWL